MRRWNILGILLLGACGSQEESQVASNAAGAEAPAAAAHGPGSASGLVPDFPGATPIEVPNLGAPGTHSRSGNATMRETDATPDQVAAFYREHFQKAGIPVRADSATARGGLISVARDGEKGAMITISRSAARPGSGW